MISGMQSTALEHIQRRDSNVWPKALSRPIVALDPEFAYPFIQGPEGANDGVIKMAPAYPPVDIAAQVGLGQIPTSVPEEPQPEEEEEDDDPGWHSMALALEAPIPAGMQDAVRRDREAERMAAAAKAKQAAMSMVKQPPYRDVRLAHNSSSSSSSAPQSASSSSFHPPTTRTAAQQPSGAALRWQEDV